MTLPFEVRRASLQPTDVRARGGRRTSRGGFLTGGRLAGTMCPAARPDPSAARRRAVITDRLRHGRHLGAPAVVAAALAATVAIGSVAVWAGTRSSSPARVEAAAPGVAAQVPSPVLT